jgi:hypothetical protein
MRGPVVAGRFGEPETTEDGTAACQFMSDPWPWLAGQGCDHEVGHEQACKQRMDGQDGICILEHDCTSARGKQHYGGQARCTFLSSKFSWLKNSALVCARASSQKKRKKKYVPVPPQKKKKKEKKKYVPVPPLVSGQLQGNKA